MSEQVFLRMDLTQTRPDAVFYYRMPEELKSFIELCELNTGKPLAAIILNRQQDGKFEYTMGLITEPNIN